MIDPYLLKHKTEIYKLCTEFNVEKLYAFGSIVDGRFVEGKSDIDLLISFDTSLQTKKEISKALFLLWISFQKLLNCKVDLVTTKNLEGKYFKKYLDLYKEELFSK